MEKTKGKKHLDRRRRRWVDNIEIGLGEIKLCSVEGSCGCGNEPEVSIKCWEVLEWRHSLLALSVTWSYFICYVETHPDGALQLHLYMG
jgi:hypothetical protein